MPGPAADVGHRVVLGELHDAFQRPAIEGSQVEIVGRCLRVVSSHRVVTGAHLLVPRPGAESQHLLPVDGGNSLSGAGGLRHRREQVRPAVVLLAGAAWQLRHQRCRPLRHLGQAVFHLVPVGERMQALSAGFQLPRGLRATQQEHRQQGPFRRRQLHRDVEQLVILDGA